MAKHKFNIENYKSMIIELNALGYQFDNFHHNKKDKTVIMRHDVDFCLDSAFKLAQIEHEIGLKSTYFILLSSPCYSFLSENSKKYIFGIKDLGHEIGLHFDPEIYDNIEVGLELEKSVFEKTFDFKLDIISMHRPRYFLENRNIRYLGIPHTYENKFSLDMKYISDSAGKFKYGHPLDLEEIQSGVNLHILIHPIWWINNGESPSDKLRNWQKKFIYFNNEDIKKNCKSFDGKPFTDA